MINQLNRENTYCPQDLFDVKNSNPLYRYNFNIIGQYIPRMSNFENTVLFNKEIHNEVVFSECSSNCQNVYEITRVDEKYIYSYFSTMARMFIIFTMDKYCEPYRKGKFNNDHNLYYKYYRMSDKDLISFFKKGLDNMSEKFKIDESLQETELYQIINIYYDPDDISVCQILDVICENRGYGLSKGYFMYCIFSNVDKITYNYLFNLDQCYICNNLGISITSYSEMVNDEVYFSRKDVGCKKYDSDTLLSLWSDNHTELPDEKCIIEKVYRGELRKFMLLHHKFGQEEHAHMRLIDTNDLYHGSMIMDDVIRFRYLHKGTGKIYTMTGHITSFDPLLNLLVEQVLFVSDLIFKGKKLILSYNSQSRLLNPLPLFYKIVSKSKTYMMIWRMLVYIVTRPIDAKRWIYLQNGKDMRDVQNEKLFRDTSFASQERINNLKYLVFSYDIPSAELDSANQDFINLCSCTCDFCDRYDEDRLSLDVNDLESVFNAKFRTKDEEIRLALLYIIRSGISNPWMGERLVIDSQIKF